MNAPDWKQYHIVWSATTSFLNLPGFPSAQKKWNRHRSCFAVSAKTFNNRKNGLQTRLPRPLRISNPFRFMRFPAVAWHMATALIILPLENSIGKLEERKPDFNLWGYHQTMGLGYYEYFQFCEDIMHHRRYWLQECPARIQVITHTGITGIAGAAFPWAKWMRTYRTYWFDRMAYGR